MLQWKIDVAIATLWNKDFENVKERVCIIFLFVPYLCPSYIVVLSKPNFATLPNIYNLRKR